MKGNKEKRYQKKIFSHLKRQNELKNKLIIKKS